MVFLTGPNMAGKTTYLRSVALVVFRYFDGQIVRGAPRYSYRLKECVSDQRFGLLLLRQARVPELIARISA
jgi:DNA mismatch repair ATPase MutS